jgi:hypothetical protein
MQFSVEDIDASDFADLMLVGDSKPKPKTIYGAVVGASVATGESDEERKKREATERYRKFIERKKALQAEYAAKTGKKPSITYTGGGGGQSLPSAEPAATTTMKQPFYKKPVVIAGGILAVGLAAVVLITRKGRR